MCLNLLSNLKINKMKSLSDRTLLYVILAVVVVLAVAELFTQKDATTGVRSLGMPKFSMKKAA